MKALRRVLIDVERIAPDRYDISAAEYGEAEGQTRAQVYRFFEDAARAAMESMREEPPLSKKG